MKSEQIIVAVQNGALFRPANIDAQGRVVFDLLGCDPNQYYTSAEAAIIDARKRAALADKAIKISLLILLAVGLIVSIAAAFPMNFVTRFLLIETGAVFVLLSGGFLALGMWAEVYFDEVDNK
jgi:hypothetical protein